MFSHNLVKTFTKLYTSFLKTKFTTNLLSLLLIFLFMTMSADSFNTPTTPEAGTSSASFTTPGGIAGGGNVNVNTPNVSGNNQTTAATGLFNQTATVGATNQGVAAAGMGIPNQGNAGAGIGTGSNINQGTTGFMGNLTLPTKPNMGGIDMYGVWTGGEPTSHDWLLSKNTRPHSQACYRNGKDFRVYSARIKGLESKFPAIQTSESKVTITSFCSNVLRHLQLHGMDSVFYVLYSDGSMYNIVKNHTLLRLLKS